MAKGIREMRRRIQSVSSTEQITKTMQMVSAAKLRRAETVAYQARDYTDAVISVVNRVLSQIDPIDIPHPFLEKREGGKTAIVAITSDRGLCGAFNGNLVRAALEEYEKEKDYGASILMLGNRGVDSLRRLNIPMLHEGRDVGDMANVLTLRQITPIIERLWREEGYGQLKVVYAYHTTAISYDVRVLDILPFVNAEKDDITSDQYLFEPGAEAVVSSLLPSYLEASLFKALLETKASEHGARMAAMDNASRNAADMIKRLTLEMNSLRQTAITNELLEIINGAEALKG